MTVNELRAEINHLQGEIIAIQTKKTNDNISKFAEECLNLIYGVGEGYIEEDYYARARYSSKIQGVKNIRINYLKDKPIIIVKIISPSGYLLPDEITLEGRDYEVEIDQSSHYREEVDY